MPSFFRRISVVVRAIPRLAIVFRATSFVVSLVSSVVPFVGLNSVVGSSCPSVFALVLALSSVSSLGFALRPPSFGFLRRVVARFSFQPTLSYGRRVFLVWPFVSRRRCAHGFCTTFFVGMDGVVRRCWSSPPCSFVVFRRYFRRSSCAHRLCTANPFVVVSFDSSSRVLSYVAHVHRRSLAFHRMPVGFCVALRVLIVYAPRRLSFWLPSSLTLVLRCVLRCDTLSYVTRSGGPLLKRARPVCV